MPTTVCDVSPELHRWTIVHAAGGERHVYALAGLRHPLLLSLGMARAFLGRCALRGERVHVLTVRRAHGDRWVDLPASELSVEAHHPPRDEAARLLDSEGVE
jgi:hypothetical protein